MKAKGNVLVEMKCDFPVVVGDTAIIGRTAEAEIFAGAMKLEDTVLLQANLMKAVAATNQGKAL